MFTVVCLVSGPDHCQSILVFLFGPSKVPFLFNIYFQGTLWCIFWLLGAFCRPLNLGFARAGSIRKSLPHVDETPYSVRFTPVPVRPFNPKWQILPSPVRRASGIRALLVWRECWLFLLWHWTFPEEKSSIEGFLRSAYTPFKAV